MRLKSSAVFSCILSKIVSFWLFHIKHRTARKAVFVAWGPPEDHPLILRTQMHVIEWKFRN
uniref:Uncharacterized protein n=1 Tax=Arundo donax TaxID=35708 RepID=A0A0A9CL46_ARUDO